MENTPEKRRNGEEGGGGGRRGNNALLLLLVFASVLAIMYFNRGTPRSQISYSFFSKELARGNIESVQIGTTYVLGRFKTPPLPESEPGAPAADADTAAEGDQPKPLLKEFRFERLPDDGSITELKDELLSKGVHVEGIPKDNTYDILSFIMILALPLVIIGFFIYTLRRSRGEMMGGGFLSGFSKSPAKRFEKSEQAITFKDVAGLEGVKADLQEIVDFLKSPEKFQKLGGRVPKGVLLNGPPGTGKTLLARAVAGEAEVPYFSVNGSEFIQMFVGVGASRVRDLFRTAKESSPAIIFIDEIDAVGRQRGAGLGGGHDEREQTLNQILSEMDGFSPSQAVIVIAATNRPDVLDPALLRPGRFDRHVTVGRPTLKGREEIFKVHVRDVPLAEDVDLHRLAAGTVGLTGADIRNMVNEAALWAARGNKKAVDMSDFEYARDKILMGAKREEVLQESEKEKTAYHEAGHTLTAWHLDGANIVHKVTIIPRGRALGVTQYIPSEDRLSISKHELEHQLIVLLGGRAAEQLVYGEMTVGAENDLERASNIARRMVTHWGMSEKLGPVSYKMSDDDPFLGREMHKSRTFSEHTQEMIDEEVHKILTEADKAAQDLLTKHRDQLEAVSRALLEREELSEAELTEILGLSIQARQREENGKVKPETVLAPESASEHSPGPAVNREDPAVNREDPAVNREDAGH
ncbi:ATP-dependent zinc metalloprotease FtsH [Roseimaritima sediminicola]|uniref:ATP-dependent zinc metalloprotease FtsH n=1 Tax=Roseimaritima sediminicola TaxID=2662066 RepID=UPI0012984B98|nr:ATP-dependent zinc metalloprotease FtsH [Roseimaritima sediminicola]